MIQVIRHEGTAGALRAALLALVALGVVGTAFSLAYDRHWGGWWQLAPWATLGGIVVAVAAVMVRATSAALRFARVWAVVTIVSAVLGLWRHFDENYKTAPLDGSYADRWEAMSTTARWWDVANGSVGHVPVPASAVLVPIGLALWMAMIGLDSSTQNHARL